MLFPGVQRLAPASPENPPEAAKAALRVSGKGFDRQPAIGQDIT